MTKILVSLAILATVSPVSAGEIGVRSSWGRSSTHMTHGRSITTGESRTTSTESHRGILGENSTRTRSTSRFTDSYNFTGSQEGGFTETSIFSRW